MTAPVLEIVGLSKDYRGLRPLRLQALTLAAGEHVALVGFDAQSAEMLVNLVTGATLPDAGTITVFGRLTSAIADSDDWLTFVDRFGIVSPRAVLLDGMTVLQNLALPFTLAIEPPPAEIAARAAALATEVGLSADVLERRVGELPAGAQMRVRLARALALDPSLLMAEHASAGVDRADVVGLAEDLRRVAKGRGVALVVATADEAFAAAVGARVFTWQPATGRLDERKRGFFSRFRSS